VLRRLNQKDNLDFFIFASKYNVKQSLFNDFIKNRKIAFIEDVDNKIVSLVYVEKKDKNYITVVSDSKKSTNNLLKILFWNFKKDLYAEINIKNKLGFILKENGFRIIDKQDNTFILYFDANKRIKKYAKRNHK